MPVTDLPQSLLQRLNQLGLERLTAFQFAVEIDGRLPGARFLVGFDRIEGLQANVQLREVREGGYPGVHVFPRAAVPPALTLVKGMTFSRELFNWYQEVVNWDRTKDDYRRDVAVTLISRVKAPPGTGIVGDHTLPFEAWTFQIARAWPSAWVGPTLNSTREEHAFESVVLQHEGISEVQGVFSGTAGDLLSLFQ